jgi:hypothetical protein
MIITFVKELLRFYLVKFNPCSVQVVASFFSNADANPGKKKKSVEKLIFTIFSLNLFDSTVQFELSE